MYAEFKLLLVSSLLALPFFVDAQCPSSLNNTNGLGALTLFFQTGQTPDNLTTIDVDFPSRNGNYAVTQFSEVYQTTATDFSGITLTGDLTLNYSDGSTEICAYENGIYFNPLPVELSEFSGQLKQDNILLSWATSSEKDNAFFEIERSFDGDHFSTVGFLGSQGDSDVLQQYNFLDQGVKDRALSSNAYYRLLQVDFDGTKTYSEVLVIDLELDYEQFEITKITGWDSGERIIRVYFYSPYDVRKVNFLVTDISGRIIEKRSVYPISGLNTFEVDLSNEESPFYFLSLNNGKEIIAEKVALASDY